MKGTGHDDRTGRQRHAERMKRVGQPGHRIEWSTKSGGTRTCRDEVAIAGEDHADERRIELPESDHPASEGDRTVGCQISDRVGQGDLPLSYATVHNFQGLLAGADHSVVHPGPRRSLPPCGER